MTNQWNDFDQLLNDNLTTDALPSKDFNAKLMARVKETPQDRRKLSHTTKRTLSAMAACAAIALIIVPVINNHAKSAPKTAAALAEVPRFAVESYSQEKPEAEEEFALANMECMPVEDVCEPEADTQAASQKELFTGEIKSSEDAKLDAIRDLGDAYKIIDSKLSEQIQKILTQMDISPYETTEDSYTYRLTPEQILELEMCCPDFVPGDASVVILPKS